MEAGDAEPGKPDADAFRKEKGGGHDGLCPDPDRRGRGGGLRRPGGGRNGRQRRHRAARKLLRRENLYAGPPGGGRRLHQGQGRRGRRGRLYADASGIGAGGQTESRTALFRGRAADAGPDAGNGEKGGLPERAEKSEYPPGGAAAALGHLCAAFRPWPPDLPEQAGF